MNENKLPEPGLNAEADELLAAIANEAEADRIFHAEHGENIAAVRPKWAETHTRNVVTDVDESGDVTLHFSSEDLLTVESVVDAAVFQEANYNVNTHEVRFDAPTLNTWIAGSDMVVFKSSEQARQAGHDLQRAADKFDELLIRESGRRVIEVWEDVPYIATRFELFDRVEPVTGQHVTVYLPAGRHGMSETIAGKGPGFEFDWQTDKSDPIERVRYLGEFELLFRRDGNLVLAEVGEDANIASD